MVRFYQRTHRKNKKIEHHSMHYPCEMVWSTSMFTLQSSFSIQTLYYILKQTYLQSFSEQSLFSTLNSISFIQASLDSRPVIILPPRPDIDGWSPPSSIMKVLGSMIPLKDSHSRLQKIQITTLNKSHAFCREKWKLTLRYRPNALVSGLITSLEMWWWFVVVSKSSGR
jgi:hypothetical protein